MNPNINCGLQVCLSSGNYNKIPQTGWLKQHLFLTVVEARKSEIKVQADLVLTEGPLPAWQWAAFS